MRILGIETSCDETAAAVLEVKEGEYPRFLVASSIIASQAKLHARYGGVVPEVAAREHIQAVLLVIFEALRQAGVRDPKKELDAIAVTQGPGLMTALLVGVETAKALSYLWKKPLVPANHLAGHVFSPLLGMSDGASSDALPVLSLIVSGGHTEFVFMEDWKKFRVIGRTLDDAAGEAFDKVAKMLDLGYPGGPEVSRRAEKGDPKAFDFPRPMIKTKNFDMSFSGLKTAVLYAVKDVKKRDEKFVNDVCASFEQAVIDVLTEKTKQAAERYGAKTVFMGGGVSANQKLREALATRLSPVACHLSPLFYTGDNAAMIAIAGYFEYAKTKKKSIFDATWKTLEPDPNLSL